MTVSNDKNISLKCFYDSLFAAGNIFIEESIYITKIIYTSKFFHAFN